MIEAIKKNKNTHLVTRKQISYELEPLITIKYNVNVGITFSDEKWNEIILDNKYYYYDRIAQNKLKKMLTKEEVIIFLEEKEASKFIIDKLIKKYLDYGYINDLNYAKLFIEQRKYKDGPKLITNKLKNKGIDLNTIDEALKNVDEPAILETIIIKKLSTNKNKSKNQLINKLKQSLNLKGYSYDIINQIIENNISYYQVDELVLIEKEFDKQMLKTNFNLADYQTKLKFRNKLLSKGFKLEDIKKVENKYKNDV